MNAGMVQKPSCVNKFAIVRLLQYQAPRSIILVVPNVDACTKHLAPLSPLVQCLQQDVVLPGLTKAIVQEELETAYPAIRAASENSTWQRTGWYLQQVRLPCFSP